MEVDIAGKLFPNITTMIVQLISTGILFFFFTKFLYGPMQNFLSKRADFIQSNMDEAKSMNAKAKVHMEESEKLAKVGAKEYREVVEKAKQDAQVQGAKIIEEAKETANRRLVQADKEIAAQKEKAQAEMQQEIVEIAMSAAKKVVEKEMDEASDRALVEKFINEVKQ